MIILHPWYYTSWFWFLITISRNFLHYCCLTNFVKLLNGDNIFLILLPFAKAASIFSTANRSYFLKAWCCLTLPIFILSSFRRSLTKIKSNWLRVKALKLNFSHNCVQSFGEVTHFWSHELTIKELCFNGKSCKFSSCITLVELLFLFVVSTMAHLDKLVRLYFKFWTLVIGDSSWIEEIKQKIREIKIVYRHPTKKNSSNYTYLEDKNAMLHM